MLSFSVEIRGSKEDETVTQVVEQELRRMLSKKLE
jgi:hypothetical protein